MFLEGGQGPKFIDCKGERLLAKWLLEGLHWLQFERRPATTKETSLNKGGLWWASIGSLLIDWTEWMWVPASIRKRDIMAGWTRPFWPTMVRLTQLSRNWIISLGPSRRCNNKEFLEKGLLMAPAMMCTCEVPKVPLRHAKALAHTCTERSKCPSILLY